MSKGGITRERQRTREYIRRAAAQTPNQLDRTPEAPARLPLQSGIHPVVGRRAETPAFTVEPPFDWWNHQPRPPMPKSINAPYTRGVA